MAAPCCLRTKRRRKENFIPAVHTVFHGGSGVVSTRRSHFAIPERLQRLSRREQSAIAVLTYAVTPRVYAVVPIGNTRFIGTGTGDLVYTGPIQISDR
jgi:hypothetical protein